MDLLFDAMASVLAFFYGLVPSYSVSIILLTLVVMVVLTPLTLKGTRSMMMMQQLQPEMRKIQNKYKDDRQRLNEELLKFYKENNINPMGGCLPLLAQMPVFIVLYAVLRGLTRRESDMGFAQGWVSGQAATDTGPSQVPDLMLDFDPAYIEPSTDLYQSLSQTNVMEAFGGIDLSESASQALSISIVEALPYFVLIAIVGASGWIQQKQIQGRQTGEINPQQQMIMKFMPLMLPVFSFGLPAGLVLYFAVSNLYRVGQQWFISRNIYGVGKDKPKGGKDTPKGGKDKELVATGASKDKKDDRASKGGGSSSNGRGGQAKGSKQGASKGSKQGGQRSSSRGGKGQKQGGGKGSSAKGGGSDPVLQPRARKRKKR